MLAWSVVAVAVILGAVGWLGTRDTAVLATDDAVRCVLGAEHPEFRPREIARSTHLRSALAHAEPAPEVAVAFAVGNQVTSRLLHPGEVQSVETSPRIGLVDATIRTHDAGCPRIDLTLPAQQWPPWQARLARLVAGGLCALMVCAVDALAQSACGDSIRIVTRPATPRQGTFFRVVVTGAPTGADLSGSAGRAPLHLARDSASTVAWAGVAVDHEGPVALQIVCRLGDRTGTVTHEVAVRPGSYPTERLRVAPEFATPPDSALAARIERESARAREVAQRSHDTPRLWDSAWRRPRPSRVTSGYGRGRQFNNTITSRHMGTDFAGVTGARVVAANRGVVRIVDRFYYGGNVVYLDHGSGITTAYLHLSKQLVAEGDTVKAGQPIGHVGATGRVTGPHLHLIARYGTMSLDPLSLLGGATKD